MKTLKALAVVSPLLLTGLLLVNGCTCADCKQVADQTQPPAKPQAQRQAQPQAQPHTKSQPLTGQAVAQPAPASAGSGPVTAAAPANTSQSTESSTSADQESQAPSFMIDEAKLPQGFPKPGPVGEVIVKTYPAARIALFAPDDNRSGDDMFMPLFKHIERNNVPMTSPVEMTFKPVDGQEKRFRSVSMAFVYPSPATGKVGLDKDVVVQDVGPTTVLSVGFRGGYGRSNFIDGYDKIQAYMTANPGKYKPAGPARLMAYNSPFVPFFLKYGEVQLPVEITSP